MRAVATEVWKSYPLPFLALLPAFTNVDALLAIFFSLHGGLAWLLILAALPWVVIRIARVLLAGEASKWQRKSHALGIAIGYVFVSLASSTFLAWRLSPPLKLTLANVLPSYFFPLSMLVGH